MRIKALPYCLFGNIFRGGVNSALAEPQNLGFIGKSATIVKGVADNNVKKGFSVAPQDGRIKKLSVNAKVPLKVEKDAVNGASKVKARSNSAESADESADTDEYTFGFGQKELQGSYRYTYFLLQDLTCTYPEDVYTNVQYSWESSSENIYLVQDANNVLGNGEGRIYVCNSRSEVGTITITATLLNGDDVVASDSYTFSVIMDFGFNEFSAIASFGKPFTPPFLTNIYGTSVTYLSGNTSIATVDENGIVTPVSEGYTTIFAILDADNSVTASYSLKVEYIVVSLPYEETFVEGIGDFTIDNEYLEEGQSEVWVHDDGNQCMTATGNVDANNKVSESWLISPFTYIADNNDFKTSLTFEQAINNGFGNIDSEATLWIREMGGEWKNIVIPHPVASADGLISGFEVQTVDLTAYTGKTIQYAFKYASSAEFAGTWCIKNILIESIQKRFVFSPYDITVIIGDKFTAPKLINDYEDNVVYSSTDESVASVDENTGAITIVGLGATSINAYLQGNEYVGASCAINVIGQSPENVPYNESFAESKGTFIINDMKLGEGLSDVWTHDIYNMCMKATADVDGNNEVSESWLISPVLICGTVPFYMKYFLSFEQAVNNGFGDIAGEATLWIREEGGDWQNMAISHPTAPTDGTLSEFEVQTVDMLEYAGKRIQLAFKYTSSAKYAGTWCIRNIMMGTRGKTFAFSFGSVEAIIGEDFTVPTLINEYEGEVRYYSWDPSVATVDENSGMVTLVGPGQTMIVASWIGEDYLEVSYVLTVIDPSSVDLPYDESFSENVGVFTVNNVMLGDGLSDVWTHDGDNQSMKATAKVGGNSTVSESWLISPIINSDNNNNCLSLSFDQAVDNGFGNIETEATLWVREVDGEWEQVAIGYPTAASDFENQTVDISRYAMKRIQIAFRYTSSSESAGTWNIRNVSVKAFNKMFAFSEYGVEATIGEEFTAPALINDYEGYNVCYESWNTDVASVDENTGEVTLVGPGEAIIYAYLPEMGYISSSYTLTVIDPFAVGVPYDESFAWEMGRFTIDDVVLGDGQPGVWTHDDDNQCMKATATVDGNNNVSESWLVSPVISKVADDMKLVLTFEQAIDNGFGDIETEATLWVREEGGEWQNMPIAHPAVPADGTISEFESQTVNLSAYSGKRIQIAFKYTNNAETAGTWLVRNIFVDKAYKEFRFSESYVEATIGEEFTAPTLINDYGNKIIYLSCDTDVATVDENTGEVTLVGQGTAEIRATFQEDELNYTLYYLTVFDPFSAKLPYDESFTENAGKFTIDDVTLGDGLSDVWTHDDDNQSMKAMAKVDGVCKASESWLVSPVIKGESDKNGFSLSFEQTIDNGFGCIEEEATLWAREENGEWEQIAIGYPSAASDFENQTVNISKYAGKRMQIAFKYTSSTEAAGTWSIRNVSVNAFNKRFAFSTRKVEVTIGEEFTAPTLTNDYADEGTVIYFSNDESIAAVDENSGEVTPVSPGITQIWADIVKEDDIIRSTGYTITVTGEPLAYYKKVTSADELTDGGTYVILNEAGSKVMGTVGSGNSASVVGVAKVNASSETCRVSGSVNIVIEQQPDGSYALRNRNGYVGCDANADLTAEAGDASEAGRQWTIGITAQGDAEIQNVASAGRYIRFDVTESVFRTYTSGEGAAVQLYKKVEDGDVLEVCELWWGTNVDFRAVGNDGAYYATFSLNDDVVFPDEVEVKTATVSNSKMTLKDVEKTLYFKEGNRLTLAYGYYVPKGSGVLLRSTKESTPYYFVLDGGSGKPLDESNMLRAVEYDGVFEGEEGYRYYKLAYDDYDKKTDLGFYYGAPDGGPFEMRMGLAYLAVQESALSQTSEAAPAHFVFGGDGDVTTIRDIEAERSAKNPVIYNMAGQHVEAIGQPGIYFVNGKKVVVK